MNRLRTLIDRLLEEIAESPVGCYAVGEFHAPVVERQRHPNSSIVVGTEAESEGL